MKTKITEFRFDRPCIKCGGVVRYVRGQKCVSCHIERTRKFQRADSTKARRKEQNSLPDVAQKIRKRRIDHYNKNPKKYMLYSARKRAKEDGCAFTITEEDIKIPFACPLLNIPIFKNENFGGPSSPSLDRIDPNGGYVPGNVWVISHRANNIKSNATLDELKLIVAGLELQSRK